MDPLDFGELEDLDKLLLHEGGAGHGHHHGDDAALPQQQQQQHAQQQQQLTQQQQQQQQMQQHMNQMQQQQQMHQMGYHGKGFGFPGWRPRGASFMSTGTFGASASQHAGHHGVSGMALDYQVESEDSDDGMLRMSSMSAALTNSPGLLGSMSPLPPAISYGSPVPGPESLSRQAPPAPASFPRRTRGSSTQSGKAATANAETPANTAPAARKKKGENDGAKTAAEGATGAAAKQNERPTSNRRQRSSSSGNTGERDEDEDLVREDEDKDGEDARSGDERDADGRNRRTGKFDRVRKSFREKQRRAEHSEIFTTLARTLGLNPRQQRGELLQAAVAALNNLSEENRMLRSHMVMMQARAVATIESFTGMSGMYGMHGMHGMHGMSPNAAAAMHHGAAGMPGGMMPGMPGMPGPGFYSGGPFPHPAAAHMAQHHQQMQQHMQGMQNQRQPDTDQAQKRRRVNSEGCSPGACGPIKPSQQGPANGCGSIGQTNPSSEQQDQQAKSLTPSEPAPRAANMVPPMHMMAAMIEQEGNHSHPRDDRADAGHGLQSGAQQHSHSPNGGNTGQTHLFGNPDGARATDSGPSGSLGRPVLARAPLAGATGATGAGSGPNFASDAAPGGAVSGSSLAPASAPSFGAKRPASEASDDEVITHSHCA